MDKVRVGGVGEDEAEVWRSDKLLVVKTVVRLSEEGAARSGNTPAQPRAKYPFTAVWGDQYKHLKPVAPGTVMRSTFFLWVILVAGGSLLSCDGKRLTFCVHCAVCAVHPQTRTERLVHLWEKDMCSVLNSICDPQSKFNTANDMESCALALSDGGVCYIDRTVSNCIIVTLNTRAVERLVGL
ncbi:hypothetical protein K439DRAFT_1621219 [Ramaria rubella]|nr:hypothetical protein K439DRAFT_1621219 [Ramaria rubella]